MAEKTEHRIKFVVVGNLHAGKTAIIKRFVNDHFSNNYKSTVGVDFALKIIDVDPKTRVHLQLWDIAGQDRFDSMTSVYYANAAAALVVFDLTSQQSYHAVDRWKNDIEAKIRSDDAIPMILLGNKCDVVDEKGPAVPYETIEEYAKTHNFVDCRYTSAKADINIKEPILQLLKRVLDNMKAEQEATDIIMLTAMEEQKKEESDCC